MLGLTKRVWRAVSLGDAFAGDALDCEAVSSWGVSGLEEVAGRVLGVCATEMLVSVAGRLGVAGPAESTAMPSERVAVLEERLAVPLEAPEVRMAIPLDPPDEAPASFELLSPPVPVAPSLKAAVCDRRLLKSSLSSDCARAYCREVPQS